MELQHDFTIANNNKSWETNSGDIIIQSIQTFHFVNSNYLHVLCFHKFQSD